MFGFTNIGQRSDHAIAAFLRRNDAIDDFITRANSSQWSNASGVILVALYTGEGGMTVTYWVRDDLAAAAKRLKKPS